MKLKLTYDRSSERPTDIVVTTDAAASVNDVAVAIAAADPVRPTFSGSDLTLGVAPFGTRDYTTLDPTRAIGDAAIASGFAIRILNVAASAVGRRTAATVVVRVTAGPDKGREFPLGDGSFVIGRDASCDVVLTDRLVSKRHARLEVGSLVELVDQNSANGLMVDGGLVSRLVVQPGVTVTLGDTVLSFLRTESARDTAIAEMVRGGAIPFNRSPRVEHRYAGTEYPRPVVPSETAGTPFPFLMLVAPVLMGTAMYLITSNPMSLLFVAMAPMMMLGNFLTTRMRSRRQLRDEIAKYEEQLAVLANRLAGEVPREQGSRQLEAPALRDVIDAIHRRGPLLWTRRPEHWAAGHLRLGTASLPSRNRLSSGVGLDSGLPEYSQKLADLEDQFRHVPDVPVVESLHVAGALGVVGPAPLAHNVLRGLVLQLVGLHAPPEMVVTSMAEPSDAAELGWLAWLPHVGSAHSPLAAPHLADSAATVASLVAALEELVADRLGRRAGDPVEPRGPLGDDLGATGAGGAVGLGELDTPKNWPLVIVIVTNTAPMDRARVTQLGERGASVGVLLLWLAPTTPDLPALCRTFVTVDKGLGDAEVHFVRHGQVIPHVRIEEVSRDEAQALASALAPLSDAGGLVDDGGDIPRSVSIASLLGDELLSSGSAVLDRWSQNLSVWDRAAPPRPLPRPSTLRALVGSSGTDAMHLDLRTQGPHALVGGTTGSGKSEFLQAWVLGMAAEYSPDRLTFLFVDYKGGSAFADCVSLPHCVGLVTDLSPHLVQRALTSLRAEVHHREHLLNRKRAKDLLDLEMRGDHECPPTLVLVIDEFAALATEVPDFVDGVVDIAQRGRSLGIHLIMATQRPAGVIRDNLRANTNLRIALRMADDSDSTDVIGTNVAGHFDPSIPGRAAAKTGPGRLSMFQSAYAGGRSSAVVDRPAIVVAPLGFGAEVPWPAPDALSPRPEVSGPTDQARLVAAISEASQLASVPAPRRPWLNELRPTYDLASLGPRTDTELIIGVADYPERQAQYSVSFRPDTDGHLVIYGTSGSGKTVALRTLAIGAGVTPRGGPVHVYGLDFGAGGLRMLDALSHVGAIVPGDNGERVVRLLRTLRAEAERRARSFSDVNATSVTDYRKLADKADEPRILLLVDNFPAFREAYDVGGARAQWYAAFQQLLVEGRQLGIHVVFTADRLGAVPSSVSSSVSRRLVLRIADESGYMVLGVPTDVLSLASPPGRGLNDGAEVQVAVLGGSASGADQARAIANLAPVIAEQGRAAAPPIGALPTEIDLDQLPREVDGWPLLGISDETLAPMGLDPVGPFLIGGGPASGRTNALIAVARSVQRWDSAAELVYFGNRRSPLPEALVWSSAVVDPADIAVAARELAARVADPTTRHRIVVVIEGVSDFLTPPTDSALIELVRAVKRSDHLLIAESDTSTWVSMYPLYTEIRGARHGLLLQPDATEGEVILRASFPRAPRSEFPVGRGMVVQGGKVVRVQMPLA